LFQDIPHDLHSSIQHWQEEPYNRPIHDVQVTNQDSIVYRIFQKTQIEVNSIHHQGVKTLAPGLKETARSHDGVIEAYENRNGGQFLMGVQWHPERMWRDFPDQFALFKEFITAARNYREANSLVKTFK